MQHSNGHLSHQTFPPAQSGQHNAKTPWDAGLPSVSQALQPPSAMATTNEDSVSDGKEIGACTVYIDLISTPRGGGGVETVEI